MWGETTRTLIQYRGVVHCVGETIRTLMQYRGEENTHTNAAEGGGPLCEGRQYAH